MTVNQNNSKKFQLAQRLIGEQAKLADLELVDWSQSLSSLGLDELDLIELTIRLEDALRVEIADLAVSGDLTLSELIDLL